MDAKLTENKHMALPEKVPLVFLEGSDLHRSYTRSTVQCNLVSHFF